jgi:hypothetical protein
MGALCFPTSLLMGLGILICSILICLVQRSARIKSESLPHILDSAQQLHMPILLSHSHTPIYAEGESTAEILSVHQTPDLERCEVFGASRSRPE